MKLKRVLFIFLLFLSIKGLAYTILIDPGHGGEDTGAMTHFKNKSETPLYEKDLALEISKKIYKKLKAKYSVYLSRSLDRTVTLEERAELAEKIKADLFISIHINSSLKKSSNGFEIYYLDNHDDIAVKKVEQIENQNLEGDALIVKKILTDLVIERTAKTSMGLAHDIHYSIKKKISKTYKIKDRGVKPGLFYVLTLSKRPGVLIEIGFLSNTNEAKKMKNKKFQKAYASSIAKGIDRFIRKIQGDKISLF